MKLEWKSDGAGWTAVGDQGTYRVDAVGPVFEVRRNGRLFHTAGYIDAALGQAQIDNDDRARRKGR